jgi:RHS repeat-associated protein
VEIVRDDSADTDTATHAYGYAYDADGNQTAITDSSPGAAIASYAMAYDQDGRNTSVTEDNSAGTAVHTTTYGYDAASNLTSQVADGAPSGYAYNDLNQQVKETDAQSSADTDPQVTTFAYDPTGQVASEVKPNGNTVTSTYYANGLLYQQTEDTSGGTLVSSHAYAYDPDGNTAQDVEQLQSAGSSGGYLDHTLTYAYDPMDQVDTVATDGTVTESYTHDADNDVTAQTVDGTTTDYGYNLGQLQTAASGGTTADYNYDPIGRLDTVTAGGQTIQSNTYDGFDNLTATSQLNTSTNSMDTTSYAYDSQNRVTSETTAAGTSSYSYLGLSSELVSEQDPGGVAKTYDYTPGGARLSQDVTGGTGPAGYGYYSYNSHSDVEAVTGADGDTTATYGYTAYGDPISSMFTGADQSDATASPAGTTTPYSSYRFNAMRWDSSSGSYDMGFRNYDPGLNQFASRDMYDGALDNTGLTTDPFTGSQYAFGNGNPISNIETNGHSSCPPPTINCGGSTPSEYVDLPAGEPSPAVAGALNGLPSVINGAARTAQTQKIDNESNFANNLALATSWIPDADEGTSIAAGFFQVLKGGNAIQDGDTTGGIGDLANGALDVAGGKILEGLGSLAGNGVSTVANAVSDVGDIGGGEVGSQVDYFDPDNDLVNAVHNQRIADGRSVGGPGRGNYGAALLDDRSIITGRSGGGLHAEQDLINQANGRTITDLYTERAPCAARCQPLVDGYNVTWTVPWNGVDRSLSNSNLYSAVQELWRLYGSG